jgi:hypothetical protein
LLSDLRDLPKGQALNPFVCRANASTLQVDGAPPRLAHEQGVVLSGNLDESELEILHFHSGSAGPVPIGVLWD